MTNRFAPPFNQYQIVATLSDRNAIAADFRSEGMRVYVLADSSEWILGAGLLNADWVAYTPAPGDISHGSLTDLSADDHTQYHNNTRGDVRYYTKTLLDGGQLDTRYYTISATDLLLDDKIDTSARGASNGVASLDGGGKVPVSQLPSSIMEYQGVWDASTNNPSLIDGSGSIGDVYRVSVAGTQNLGSGAIVFNVGDYAISSVSGIWEKADTTDSVPTVFGRTGNVTATSGDYIASQITNTPNGNIAAITVQNALNELDSEKVATSAVGAASGVASLDGTTLVPTAQVATGTANSSTYLRGDRTWTTFPALVTAHGALTGLSADDHTQYQLRSEKNAASGYAGLDGGSKLNGAQQTYGTSAANVTRSAASAGIADTASRSDHKHDVSTAAPVAIGTANSAGSASTLALSDHVHAHGAQTDTSLHALATAALAGFMSGADKARLDKTNVVARYLRVSKLTTDDADYISIKAAVDAAVSGGADADNPWHIVVTPGFYTEDPFTLAPGVQVASAVGTGGGVTIEASDAVNDFITMTGGSLTGVTLNGVTDPAKALIRANNPYALGILYFVELHGCSNGLVIEGGAAIGAVVLSTSITDVGMGTDVAVTVTGAGSKLSLLGGFYSAPAALLPAYITNPIGIAINVNDGGSVDAVGCSFSIAPKDSSQVTLLVNNGGSATVLSSVFTGSTAPTKIGAGGSGSRIDVLGTSYTSNTTNFIILSSTGQINVNASVDTDTRSIVAGGALSGSIAVRSTGRNLLTGETVNDFPSGRFINLDSSIAKILSSGVHAGGVVTDGGGLTVDLSAGHGFVVRDTPLDAVRSEWSATTGIALTASATNYIYFDGTTLAVTAGVSPPSDESILFASVVTSGSAVRYIHDARNDIAHPARAVTNYLIAVHKFTLKSGVAASQGSSAIKLNIGSGSYYSGYHEIDVAGGTDVTFSAYYNAGATELTGQTTLNITQYDNAGTLTTLTAGYFRTDSVLITSDNKVSVIFGTAQYSTSSAAMAASFANVPSFLEGSGFRVANIIVEEGVGIDSIVDARPQLGSASSGSSGVSVHASLSGLSADDHTQYLLASGARAMGGTLDMSSNTIVNAGTINSVSITAHASRHNPGGADAIATAAPAALLMGSVGVTGSAASVAVSDHVHPVSRGTPVSVGTANSAGTSSAFAGADHVHAHGIQTVDTQHALATTSTHGFISSSDKTKLDGIATSAAALTSSAPVNVTKAAAAVGVATDAARADHKHDVTTASATSVGAANAEGSASSLARSDHTHQVVDFAISGQVQGDTLYFNGTNWVRLAPGTSGQFLQTSGASANPSWASTVTAHSGLTGLSADDHAQYQLRTEKAAASGYASLDSGVQVPTAQMATGTATSSTYLRGDRTWTTFPTLVTVHSGLTGLSADDHAQYHTDARGDARYYTKTQLDAGQLDNRYYTSTAVDALMASAFYLATAL